MSTRKQEVKKRRITIRLDEEVLEAFREMAPEGGYQKLINEALKEWLLSEGVKEVVREELRGFLDRVEGKGKC